MTEPFPAPQPSYLSAAAAPKKQKKWVWLVGAPVMALALAVPAWNSATAAADIVQPAIAAPVLTVEFSLAKQDITASQRNAIRSARQYLNVSAFSRSGLIHQLEYEGFATADATFAVDSLNVDWNEQAAKSAKQYLELTSFSRTGLIDQLMYEGFTRAQAEHGVNVAY